MNETQQNELAGLIKKYAGAEGANETEIPGVVCYKTTTTDLRMPAIYAPCMCIIAQGNKKVMLNDEIYRYGLSEYLIASVDLPVIGQVTEATRETPYLCLQIDIDLRQMAELLVHVECPGHTHAATKRGIFTGKLDETTCDSVLRLARLMDTPDDIPVLAPMMMREIYYRLLRSDYGDRISQIVLNGSNMQRIATAIQKIKSGFREPISMVDLAELAGMSASSFHTHFKSVTAMSPLQFLKRLRLMEARHIMLLDSLDAATAAYQVGYESPSQFSREYTRTFGNPPRRDIENLKAINDASYSEMKQAGE